MTRQKRTVEDLERELAEAWKDATVNRWQRFGWEDGNAIVTRPGEPLPEMPDPLEVYEPLTPEVLAEFNRTDPHSIVSAELQRRRGWIGEEPGSEGAPESPQNVDTGLQ